MNGYKMDWTTKTITITKAFAAEALIPNSPASQILQGARAVCPDLKIISKAANPSQRRNTARGLTYAKMEKYMMAFEDSAATYGEFLKIKQLSLSQPNNYLYVKDWFLSKFPNYDEFPTFVDGKIYLESPKTELQAIKFDSENRLGA